MIVQICFKEVKFPLKPWGWKYEQVCHLVENNTGVFVLFQCIVSLTGELPTGKVIGTLLGKIIHLSFCFCDERVAACTEAAIYILSPKVSYFYAALGVKD